MLSVILFHARIEPFSGGFVGVDIFFVISGFLITSIIVQEREEESFSFARFYERRARRILPALLFMLLGVSALAYAVLLPTELVAFGQSALATALFSVNFYFWQSTGYFAPDADHNALLHMWSLSVEEQFYLLYPILLVLLLGMGGRKAALWGLVTALAISFAVSEWLVASSPKIVFYMLPTRAWELMLGAVLALGMFGRPGRGMSIVCAAAGAGMIAWSVLTYSPGMEFPGSSALLPCVGTALLIHANSVGGSLATRILSAGPVVFIGQISYSLYLWHWPLLVLPRVYLARALADAETAALVGLALALSVFSWKYIEQPLRRRNQTAPAGRVLAVGLGASASFAGLAAFFVISAGAPWRYSEEVVLADRAQRYDPLPASCVVPDSQVNQCAGRTFDILVWGDSHAGHYFPAVEALARSSGLTVQLQAINGCPPLLGVEPVTIRPNNASAHPTRPKIKNECATANADVLRIIATEPGPRLVVLAGAWDFLSEGVDIGSGDRHFLKQTGQAEFDGARTRSLMRASLRKTVTALRALGVEVLLLGQVPDNRIAPSRCMADAYRSSASPAACGRAATAAFQRSAWSRALMASLAEEDGVHFFDPTPIICRSQRCATELGGHPLYRDKDHITAQGAIMLGRQFPRAPFRAAGERSVQRQVRADAA